MEQLRATLIALLDDKNGISDAGYLELQTLAYTIDPGKNNDIFSAVEAADNRYFLPEDHDLKA